jgi:translation initiation factor IF-1
MPINKRGGKGHKKGKNSTIIKIRKVESIAKDSKREGYEVYGQVLKPMGNRRFEVQCQTVDSPDNTTTIVCTLKGSYTKRINKDMYVLVKLFDFNPKQGTIIDSYKDEEIEALKSAELWDYPGVDSETVTDRMDKIMDESSDESDDEEVDEPIQINKVDEYDIDAI